MKFICPLSDTVKLIFDTVNMLRKLVADTVRRSGCTRKIVREGIRSMLERSARCVKRHNI